MPRSRATARRLRAAEPSRDALLTLLIIEAYDAVGEVAEQAAASGSDPAQTWLDVARAVRGWALDQPYSFELIYGTPVRGYRAPDDTVRSAVRVWGVIIGLLLSAHGVRDLQPGVGRVGAAGIGDGLLGDLTDGVVGLDDQQGQQRIAGGDVAVDRRRRHAEVTRDGAQAQRRGPLTLQSGACGGEQLGHDLGPRSVAGAQGGRRLGHGRQCACSVAKLRALLLFSTDDCASIARSREHCSRFSRRSSS